MKPIALIFTVMLMSLFGCSSTMVESDKGMGFPGIHPKYSNASSTDILIVHGMCSKKDTWFKDHVNQLAKAADSTNVEHIGKITIPDNNVNSDIHLYSAKIVTDSGDFNLYGILYSKAISDTKKDLENASVTGSRAYLNRKLKSFAMNNCLADVAAYNGAIGEDIRKGVRSVLSTLHDIRGDKTGPLVLVSESLGSKVVRDALICDQDNARREEGFQLLSNSNVFVMYANQIPFLDLASDASCVINSRLASELNASPGLNFNEQEQKLSGNFSDILRILNDRETAQTLDFAANQGPPKYWVAYSDPNDVLSYKLDMSKYGNGDHGDFQVVNVSVKNATNWFGLLANPSKAHNGYRSNPKVQNMVLHGCLINDNKCDLGLYQSKPAAE